MVAPQAPKTHAWRTRLLGAIVGGLVGFGVAWLIYTSLNGVLEASSGPAEQLQGLLWNVVPALTIVGATAGFLVAAARGRHAR